ncbi:MAG: hypothetical protein QW292_12575 [Candidatus Parvarchaeota archaeon]
MFKKGDIYWKCPECGYVHSSVDINVHGVLTIIDSSRHLEKLSRDEYKLIGKGHTKEEMKNWNSVKERRLSCFHCYKVILNGFLYSELLAFLSKHSVPPPPPSSLPSSSPPSSSLSSSPSSSPSRLPSDPPDPSDPEG